MYLTRSKTKVKLLVIFLLTMIALTATLVNAEGYIPLEPLTTSAESGVTLSSYLDDVFKIGIGLAGVFAVLMIVIGGISYIGGASSPSARSEAKGKITSAIMGLILALAAWLLLYTINPNLLKKELSISEVSVSVQETIENWFFDWRYATDPSGSISGESGPFTSASECAEQIGIVGTEIVPYGCVKR